MVRTGHAHHIDSHLYRLMTKMGLKVQELLSVPS